MNIAQCLLVINFLRPVATLFAVFKMAKICERSERATENKKSVSEEILNFLDVGLLRGAGHRGAAQGNIPGAQCTGAGRQ